MTLIRAGYSVIDRIDVASGSSALLAGARSRLCGDGTVSAAAHAQHAGLRRPMNAAVFRALIYADSRLLWRDPLLGWILRFRSGWRCCSGR